MFTQINPEPLIVVEENDIENECKRSSSEESDPDSPQNPYLLTPCYRDTRKHSLPTIRTNEITASQVRRLSEGGAETLGISPKEQEFLATLSQTSGVHPGGRRHSVVTISKVPTIFGNRRERRESIGNW